jgi:hypothetical protein
MPSPQCLVFPMHCPLDSQVGPANGFRKTVFQAASHHQPTTALHLRQMAWRNVERFDVSPASQHHPYQLATV